MKKDMLWLELQEEIPLAKERCKGHMEEFPRGLVRSFLRGVEKRFLDERKKVDLEILLKNHDLSVSSLVERLQKIQELRKGVLKNAD